MAKKERQGTNDDDAARIRRAQRMAPYVDLGGGAPGPLPRNWHKEWAKPVIRDPQESWDLMEHLINAVSMSCSRYNRLIKLARPISFDRTTCLIWAAKFPTDYPGGSAEPSELTSIDFDTRKPTEVMVKAPTYGDNQRFAQDVRAEILNTVKAWQAREPIRQRALVIKKVKDAHPDWTQRKVATEAAARLGDESITEDTVRNDYEKMGWAWQRGERTR